MIKKLKGLNNNELIRKTVSYQGTLTNMKDLLIEYKVTILYLKRKIVSLEKDVEYLKKKAYSKNTLRYKVKTDKKKLI